MIRFQITLGLLFTLAAMTLVLIIGVNEPQRLEATTAAQRGRAIETGAILFETNCSGCHGKEGEGIQGLCPPLNDKHFFTDRLKEVGYVGSLRDYIKGVIAAGRSISTRPQQYVGKMPTWSQRFGGPLRDDDIDNLTEFILNWEPTATGKVVLAAKPTPASLPNASPADRGKLVFNANGCGGCHTVEGVSTGSIGPNLSHIATVAADRLKDPNYTGQAKDVPGYLWESIVQPNAYITPQCPTGPCPSGVMPQNFGQSIAQESLTDLVGYLESLK